MNKPNIILYDGDCGFCNYWVNWVLKRDKRDRFRFVTLQSEKGQRFLEKHRLKTGVFDTLYLIKDGRYFTRMEAIAEIGATLGGIYHLMFILKLLPPRLSNTIYQIVATYRKLLAPRYCIAPSAKDRVKFIG